MHADGSTPTVKPPSQPRRDTHAAFNGDRLNKLTVLARNLFYHIPLQNIHSIKNTTYMSSYLSVVCTLQSICLRIVVKIFSPSVGVWSASFTPLIRLSATLCEFTLLKGFCLGYTGDHTFNEITLHLKKN